MQQDRFLCMGVVCPVLHAYTYTVCCLKLYHQFLQTIASLKSHSRQEHGRHPLKDITSKTLHRVTPLIKQDIPSSHILDHLSYPSDVLKLTKRRTNVNVTYWAYSHYKSISLTPHMPSTLYASVKQSVAEFAEIKRKNEGAEEKLLFRWKLLTIVLAIIFVIMIGLFSQFLKQYNERPVVQGDSSFVLPLLTQVNPEAVISLEHASRLVKGISVTSASQQEYYEWDSVEQVYQGKGEIVVATVLSGILNKEHLLLVFSKVYNTTYTARFGLYAHRGYNSQQTSAGTTTVKDEAETRFSSVFNLNNGQSLKYDVENCNLFAHNNSAITFFEGITTVTQGGQTGLQFNLTKPECYHSVDAAVGYQQLLAVTGVPAEGQPTVVLGLSLDVFRLYLKEQEQ